MRATFALFLATGLVLGGTTIGPSARAASAGHGGNYPDPAVTTSPTPGMSAYNGNNGYGPATTTPNAPGMSAYNGNTRYGTNGGAPAPAQAPAPGVAVPGQPAAGVHDLGVPAMGAARTPLAESRNLQPRAGDPTCTAIGGPPVTCSVETFVTFTVQSGVLTLSCPDWAPPDTESGGGATPDLETTPNNTIVLPIGTCQITDFRGGSSGAGSWTVTAAMDSPFTNTNPALEVPGPAPTIPNSDVTYTIPSGSIVVTDPSSASPSDLTNGASSGVNLGSPQPGVLVASASAPIYEATWSPTLSVFVPPGTPLAEPPYEYEGTLTTTVTG